MQYTTDTTPTFEAFYTRYLPLVQQVLSSLRGGYREYVDDLTQETFVKAWKAYDRLDHRQNVAAWICQIARNAARDFLRHMQARQRLDAFLDEEMAAALPDTRIDAQTVYSGEWDAVTRAYQCLPPDDQRVMALLLQDYTPPEIAQVLHLSRDACRARIQRARRRFQKHYADPFDELYPLP